MHIQLISDLHCDSDPGFVPRPLPGAQLLVLAGDIASRHFGSGSFGLDYFSPLNGWPVPVLYVPGNHEYDDGDFDATQAQLKRLCHELAITWLEHQVLVHAGVRWIGATLWADFDALVPPNANAQVRRLQRSKAMRAANFYMPRMQISRHGRPFWARQMRSLALQSYAWLEAQLALPFEGQTVVVSHFAPSLRSADPRYGVVPGTAGFCNAWDGLLSNADAWLHGHLHCHVDYVHNGCHVMANPVGYPKPQERQAYRSDWLLEV
ncbi:metallophosphoesterase [Lampropedia puyangensis]|uniref:Metallophosphoesterase n=1 Tax=Lampropedia puyangensis TaxID=1330072 RepID=A0A4S8F3V8_9BURK|nr:metallophosphoesterase [Lampropedia puyangensis]THU02043.1 metallophosphoesterase [Lampropedia puyangensis]